MEQFNSQKNTAPFLVPQKFFNQQFSATSKKLASQIDHRSIKEKWSATERMAAIWIGLIGCAVGLQGAFLSPSCQSFACLLENERESIVISDELLEDWFQDEFLFNAYLDDLDSI